MAQTGRLSQRRQARRANAEALPFAVRIQNDPLLTSQPAPQPGDLCPQCGLGKMDYDGALNLACPQCGYALSGGGGCT